jgi:hypothetical protein
VTSTTGAPPQHLRMHQSFKLTGTQSTGRERSLTTPVGNKGRHKTQDTGSETDGGTSVRPRCTASPKTAPPTMNINAPWSTHHQQSRRSHGPVHQDQWGTVPGCLQNAIAQRVHVSSKEGTGATCRLVLPPLSKSNAGGFAAGWAGQGGGRGAGRGGLHGGEQMSAAGGTVEVMNTYWGSPAPSPSA